MFTEDTRTENFLRYVGVKFEYNDSIGFDELHDKWKVHNLGRSEAIDGDAVLEYGTLMANGSSAPAVIAIKHKEGGYVVLDGVQRLSASELADETRFAAYVVHHRTGTSKQHLIRITANARINGQHTPDKTWMLSQAVDVLYFDDECSVAEIARAIGSTAKKVQEEIRFQKTSKKMESVGYTGAMANRTKKWFAAKVGEYAQEEDWQMAPTPIRQMLETFDKCKFKNGAADHLLETFFNIKRTKNKDRHTQFASKYQELRNSPEVRQKLKSDKKRAHIDDVLPALRSAGTIIDRAISASEIVHDGDFADELAASLRVVYSGCRSLVPRDLQYRNGRHSSIFDKG